MPNTRLLTVAETMKSSRPGRMGEQGVRITRRTGRVTRRTMPSHRMPRTLVRGQGYVTPNGFGYYVGTRDRKPVFCFGRLTEFHGMCDAFDASEPKPRRAERQTVVVPTVEQPAPAVDDAEKPLPEWAAKLWEQNREAGVATPSPSRNVCKSNE